ncbi:ABC transporter ATP-binding protein [Gulosibacter sediminis]|uniref:ABC transporter ATP-binding protein n=1 Tax=Gulosibacter sediminis TaxID=1729695 RepID=UPI0024A80A6F|nr:ABC transporter ATP-binding protein [Gulosibacter sediminis]
MDDSLALKLDGVTREFGRGSKKSVALESIDLQVALGEVVAVLGPNGAGKTTTVKIAATLLEPSAGSVRVAGIDAVKFPRQARAKLGMVLGGDRGFYLRATALENLRFFATLAGVSGRTTDKRISAVIEEVGLAGRERDRVETYSRGMKQRLHIARALLGEPALLLLDEPSIGLDPEGARDLRGLVRALRDAGCGVLLTTHYLDEADELADELVVINRGAVVARGLAADIAQLGDVDSVLTFETSELIDVEERLRAHPRVVEVLSREVRGAHTVEVIMHELVEPQAMLAEVGVVPEWVTVRPVSLQEAYLAFIAKDRR